MVVGGAVRDAAGVVVQPGAVALGGGRIVAAGDVATVIRAAGADADRLDLPDCLLIPGLVNAHVHLMLSSIGKQPFGGAFLDWVLMVRQQWNERAVQVGESAALGEAMAAGVRQSLRAGVLRVGDITSWQPAALHELRRLPMSGVSYVELLGIGGESLRRKGLDRLDAVQGLPVDEGHLLLGLEPHAPYSAGPTIYEHAVQHANDNGLRLSTHLAEFIEEHQFVRDGTGMFRDVLERMAQWDDAYHGIYSGCTSTVRWMEPYLRCAKWLCAHCNYVDDDDIALLAECDASVAYCPRASEYFGHRGHRYRDMIDAGVNVCLGTDSIICHGSLSILDEMRRLHARDGTDPDLLLKMATVNGMRGLGLSESDATFTPGAAAGLVAIRYDPQNATGPLAQVLSSAQRPDIQVIQGV